MSEYEGPERRIDDRRQSDMCLWHEAHEQRFRSNELKISTVCQACSDLRATIDVLGGTRVPMKLFYSTAAGIIFLVFTILAFQWTSYERLNAIGMSHQSEMSEIKIDVQKVTSAVENDRYVAKVKMDLLDSALKGHMNRAEKKYDSIDTSMKAIEEHLRNGNHRHNAQ